MNNTDHLCPHLGSEPNSSDREGSMVNGTGGGSGRKNDYFSSESPLTDTPKTHRNYRQSHHQTKEHEKEIAEFMAKLKRNKSKRDESVPFGNRNKPTKKTYVRGRPVPVINDHESPRANCDSLGKAKEFDSQRPVAVTETKLLKCPIPMDSFTKVQIIVALSTPSTYWVQNIESIKLQLQILEKLKAHCSNCTQQFTPVPKAKCSALYLDDWYRAKVLTVEPELKVQFVDFGNEEVVKPEELKPLPPDLTYISPLAFMIRLADGTSNKYHDLNEEEILSIKPISKDKNMWIVHVEGEKYPEPPEPEKCPIPYDSFVTVQIMVADGKTDYWVQLCSMFKTIYEMTKDLGSCSSAKVISPQVGEVFVRHYYDTWCRAKVISTNPLKIFYIDYGNEENVTADDLRPVPALYKDVRPMAIHIRLAEGTSTKYFDLEPVEASLDIKAFDRMADGTVIVHVQGETYKSVAPPIVEKIPRRPKLGERKTNHVVYMVKPGMQLNIEVQRVVSDNHIAGSITMLDSSVSDFVPNTVIADKLKVVRHDPKYRSTLGDMVCCMDKDRRKRGYVMGVWSNETRVALVDYALVVSSKKLSPLSPELKFIPETGIRCLFSVPFMEGVKVEGQKMLCVVTDTHDSILKVNVKGFGPAEIVPWEPLIEEAGLSSVKIGTGCKVILTAYRSPQALYVQSLKQEHLEQLGTVLQDVAAHCFKSKPLDRKPLTGEFLACKFDVDGNFYRAQVTKCRDDKFTVTFVDYGNSEIVSINDMRPLPTTLKAVPCSAVKVGLKDVPNIGFSPSAMTFLNEIASSQMELFIGIENNDLSCVTLETKTGISLNDTLQSLAQPRWKKALLNKSDASEGHVYMAPDLNYVKWHVKSKLSIMILGSLSVNTKLAASTTLEYLRHVSDTLTSQITDYCESTPSEDSYNPRPNEICLAKYEEDEKWYRALCVQPLTASSEVLFIDYGNVGEVLHSKIRCMTPDFITAPAMLKRCKIYGVPDNLSEKVEMEVNKLISEGSTHQIVVIEESDDGNVTVLIPVIIPQLERLGFTNVTPPSLS